MKTSLEQIKLLYVEDDESIRLEISDILEDMCLELILAVDGEDALSKYKEFSPDIILTDIKMPKMNGIAMAKEIKLIDKNIPIIVSSAFSDSEYLLEAIKIGISDYLIKPINLENLFQTLEKVAKTIVTLRKFNEKEQLLSQYKDVVDASSIVSKTDSDGYITYVNDAFIKISGYSRAELIGKQHRMLRHPDMKSTAFKGLWSTILSKKRWHGVIKNIAKDGSVYVVDSTIIPILDIEGNIVEFISIRVDITSIELQKEHLKSNLAINTKFIEEFENAIRKNTLFCSTSINGKILTTSGEFDNIFGYESGELEGVDYRTLTKLDEKTQNEIADTIQKAYAWKGQVTHKSKQGEDIYLESAFIPIIGIDKKVVEVFAFFTDNSEIVKLNNEIVSTQREVISTMGAIGETRSRETGLHVRRVAEYSKLLALKYGLSLEEAEELKMASPMHDIGKVAIPDSILNKPGKLTDDEFEVMKTHAELGYEMLRHSNQKLLRSASVVANQHHEKWNGQGYPNALSGEDIHIYGRITAVADVFDALGHDRVYKKAWPMEEILQLFKDERGKHFDPKLIDLLMDNLDEFLLIKHNFDGELE